jgi:hypothetical protein
MAENTVQYPDGGGNAIIQTAAEFKEKYSKKRFSSRTAPKAVLYSFLYDIYQQSEGGVKEPLYPDITGIRNKVETYEDMDAWNGYLNLTEWQRSAFNTAVFLRNALQSNLSEYNRVISSLIAAENLRAELRAEQIPQSASLWLDALTLEAYSPQADGYSIDILRKNIEGGLRYTKAYNTFVALIAEETKTPEYARLMVTTQHQQETLNDINRALTILTETAYRERAEDQGAGRWTQEYLSETLRAFEPIGNELPPIPADRISEARDGIRRGVKKGSYSWYTLYRRYSSQYWRMDVYER